VFRLSKWIEQCETILTDFQASTGIPYDFKRNETPAAQLPDSYIVYFLVDDEGKTWSEGKETSHEPRVQVSFYYKNKPDFLIYPDQIETAFVNAGFTRGPVGDIPYQPDTSHYGWRRDFYYYERR
jgi:hypothetical protein